ncbi:HNH endonuclease [Hoeflea sp.]|uniref:HNH endonuclease n=1 Tax=Hoeflea sp. TaxID=1940281 RepID=UPI0019B191C6|nr:HNH endonuclease [Hoeflea sp.]MBC7283298.1 HNH endonuclease [Hoeflea sp.]
MTLIDDYPDLEGNLSALESVRKTGQGQEFDIYRSLIAKGRVLLPYLTSEGIAFAPSRFLGYKDNTVSDHAAREHRDGRETTPRIRQVLAKEIGFTTWNVSDDVAEEHFVRFCSLLSTTPDNASRTYWITPETGDWLAAPSADVSEAGSDDALSDEDLEQEVRDDECLPKTTRESIIKARIGQGLFRRRVIQAYGRCLITGLEEQRLLIASHIRPWRECCHNPNECLDPGNALLLSPTWDALFDKGFVSFSGDGALMMSKRLSKPSQRALGIEGLNVSLTDTQLSYMHHHRMLHGFADPE